MPIVHHGVASRRRFQVQFLRRPLSSPSPSPSIHLGSLVIPWNGILETARIGKEVVEHLGRFCSETTISNGLPTEDKALSLNLMITFLNLVDIDSPISRDMTAEKMDGLKRTMELAKRIIWVTQGAQLDQGYHILSIPFSRATRQEAGHISLRHLYVSDLQHSESKTTAEYLLQQCALSEWKRRRRHWQTSNTGNLSSFGRGNPGCSLTTGS